MLNEEKVPKQNSFNDDELLRYSRHIMLPRIDVQGQLALANSSVLIVGVGGLGSPVAQYLSAAGVGTLLLADHDRVEASNLQRQVIHSMETVGELKVESAAEYITKLNPFVKVQAIAECLDGEALLKHVKSADIVVDCCDNFTTRMAVNKACLHYKKPLVSGAAIRMEGQLTSFDFRRDDTPCYQCLYDLAGDENLTCSQSGVLSPLVGIIGSSQALETIKMIVGFGCNLVGRVQLYDGANAEWREFRLKKDLDCKVCS